ncbi:MAG: hypothetical protein M0P73_00580 [Syntrophobacterales bacterium]|jgi:protein associated with RNAse G/E|nr:hypothetical protein [Syntrophobacterales bacterium]
MRIWDSEKMKRGLFVAQLTSYLNFHFEELRDYFDSVRQLIKKEEKRIADWSKSQTEKLSREETEVFYDRYSEDYLKFRDLFPSIQRDSIFIAIYAELEEALKFVCSAVASEISIDVQVYRWRGGILERIESCFKNNIGIEFPPDGNLWDKIIKIRNIRNTIVHNGSWLYEQNDRDKEIIDYIDIEKENIILIKRDDGGIFYKIQLTDAYIFGVLDSLDNFLNKLIKLLHDWSNSLNIESK